ncbi:unnamed protein product [Caenorhabditis sp. 36 PRJEB53466]|nr:unnamed protein product [Caenorhabditis sp. 36 PRJEB53466]
MEHVKLFRKMGSQKVFTDVREFVMTEEEQRENGYIYFENEHSRRAEYKRDKWSSLAFMPDHDDTRKCTRCSRLFNRKSKLLHPNACQFHPLKPEVRNGLAFHACCGKRCGTARGCVRHDFHVHRQPTESVLEQFVRTPAPTSTGDFRSNKVFALDVEMVNTENGIEAARVSLIDHKRRVLMDEYVRPEGRIVHLNTRFSGVHAHHLDGARHLEEVRASLFLFVNNTSILVGHGLANDLKVLRMVHPRVIDTGVLVPSAGGNMSSLRNLAMLFLNRSIHENPENGHCSVEDARVCLLILEHLAM